MSLNYDLSNVVDWRERLRNEDGTLQGRIEALIMVLPVMAAGVPTLTEKNAPELCARLAIYQAVYGGFLRGPNGTVNITDDDVRDLIGLRVNVAPGSRTDFLKRCISSRMDEHAIKIQRAIAETNERNKR